MSFFFKSNKIVLDCFTDDPFIYETSRINHAIKFLPDWWKNIPPGKDLDPNSMDVNAYSTGAGGVVGSTVRNCPGFIDLYKKSLVLPLWCETRIKVHPNGFYEWKASHETKIDSHNQRQFNGLFSNASLSHLKFISPWIARSKTDLQLMFVEPLWNNENLNDLRIIPGVVNTKYMNELNVNCFIEPDLEKERIINLKPLTPLVFLIPLTEKKIELKYHLITQREKFRFNSSHFFPSPNFLSSKIKISKKIEELNKKESKCPFGFK